MTLTAKGSAQEHHGAACVVGAVSTAKVAAREVSGALWFSRSRPLPQVLRFGSVVGVTLTANGLIQESPAN